MRTLAWYWKKLRNFVKGNNAIRLESHWHRNLHALDIILEILMGNFKDSSSFEADWKNTSNAKTICYSNGGIYCRLRSPCCSTKSVAGVNKHQLKKNQSVLWANSWINTWFFGLCLMLSGLGNFVVDCHIWSTSSRSVFAAKKQSNVGIRRHYN